MPKGNKNPSGNPETMHCRKCGAEMENGRRIGKTRNKFFEIGEHSFAERRKIAYEKVAAVGGSFFVEEALRK